MEILSMTKHRSKNSENLLNGVTGFYIPELSVRGRFIRLQSVVSEILHMHSYPVEVSRLLGENLLLAGLLGTTIKFDGKLILQLQGDGLVRFVVSDFKSPDRIRGCATLSDDFHEDINVQNTDLLGNGQLVFTIDQGADMQRYQGIVALEGEGLAGAAENYFAQSEQLPTKIKLAMSEFSNLQQSDAWAGGGMILQYLPIDGGRVLGDIDDGRSIKKDSDLPDEWVTAALLADTLKVDELTDPSLHPHEILYRLFNEFDVEVYPQLAISRFCQCSREKCIDLLSQFSEEDVKDMAKEKGVIEIKCQYCSENYNFNIEDIL